MASDCQEIGESGTPSLKCFLRVFCKSSAALRLHCASVAPPSCCVWLGGAAWPCANVLLPYAVACSQATTRNVAGGFRPWSGAAASKPVRLPLSPKLQRRPPPRPLRHRRRQTRPKHRHICGVFAWTPTRHHLKPVPQPSSCRVQRSGRLSLSGYRRDPLRLDRYPKRRLRHPTRHLPHCTCVMT